MYHTKLTRSSRDLIVKLINCTGSTSYSTTSCKKERKTNGSVLENLPILYMSFLKIWKVERGTHLVGLIGIEHFFNYLYFPYSQNRKNSYKCLLCVCLPQIDFLKIGPYNSNDIIYFKIVAKLNFSTSLQDQKKTWLHYQKKVRQFLNYSILVSVNSIDRIILFLC